MEKLSVNVYTIDELEGQAKENAISQGIPIVTDFGWWVGIYYEANLVDITITKFDLDSERIYINFKSNAIDVCNKIIDEHGEGCATYKVAEKWLGDENSVTKYSLIDELGDCYLTLLRQEFDYITSPDCIIKYFNANGDRFLGDGSIFNFQTNE